MAKCYTIESLQTTTKSRLTGVTIIAVDHEHFLLSNDHLCYAHSPSDSNEFKYARISLLALNLVNNPGTKGDFRMREVVDSNSHIAWARFRSVKEMRQDLLEKIQQMIYNFPTTDSIANAYAELVKTILELTDDPSYKEADYSNDYEWALSASSNNKQEIIVRITNLLYSDYFLIPVGQKSSE